MRRRQLLQILAVPGEDLGSAGLHGAWWPVLRVPAMLDGPPRGSVAQWGRAPARAQRAGRRHGRAATGRSSPSAPRWNHTVADAVEQAPEAMEPDFPHLPGRHLSQHRAVRAELMDVRIRLDGKGAGHERK